MAPGTRRSDRRPSVVTAARPQLRTAVVVAWARALASAGAVVAVGRLVDGVAAGASISGPITWLALFLAGRAALAALPPVIAAVAAGRVERDLRGRIVTAVEGLGPLGRDRRTGEIVARSTEGVEAVGAYAGRFLPQLVTGMSVPLFLVAVVAVIDVPTAIVLVLVLPLIPALLRVLERRFASVSDRYRRTADRLAARFLDGVQGLRTLKALDRSTAYGDELAAESERLRVETMRLLRVNQLALLGVDSLFTLGTVVAAAGMAGWRLNSDAVSLGEAVSLVLLGVLLIDPLTQIGRFFYVGAIGRAAARQVGELLTGEGPETPTAAMPASPGAIVARDLHFAYGEGPDVLTGIDLTVEPGERLALVGPSGAGKSTLASLVLGLARPVTGSLEVGGPVAYVPQNPYLFHGTVRDNLLLASPDASDAELWAALEAAELADTMRARGGLDAEVGERGLALSGGEAQRLAIARAGLVVAPIVVLDEPTSNVDLETEARIRSALARLTTGRTVLVIAHRRSTIAGADRVLTLDEGRITEEVSPTQLLAGTGQAPPEGAATGEEGR
jgi:ATP-binding cassette, subfamily C, bacterial CydD